jgi:glutathione synthase/RimK-type ligase-like ATP-grasp enzyme
VTPGAKTVVLLSSPKHPPRSGPPSARYQPGRGNILAEKLLQRGHHPIIWWDHPEGELLPCEPDAVILRSAEGSNIERARGFLRRGVPVYNDPGSHHLASDKWFQVTRFAEVGIPHPKTTLLHDKDWREDDLVVIKPRRGSSGTGVERLLARELGSKDFGKVIQAYVDVAFDYRVTVVDGRTFGWMIRFPPPGDFRTNLALGGTFEPTSSPSPRCDEVAVEALSALGLVIGGVDLFVENGVPMILEVNPGTTLFGPTPRETDAILDSIVSLVEHTN